MKCKTLRILRSEEGFGLLFALMAMAAVGVIGWSMMTNGMVDMTISDNFRSKSTAFYAADAGIEQSLVDLKVDNAWIDEIVDPATWVLIPLSSSSLTINGHTVNLTLDGSDYIVPGYYSFGGTTTIGNGSFTRDIYLPPTLGEYTGDCDDPTSSSGSGLSGSGSSGSSSGGSESGGSSSSGSSSGSSSSAALVPLFGGQQLGLAAVALAAAAKVDICHVPPGNPSNSFTISVSTNALSAHLGHGDTTGACVSSSGSSSGSGSGSGSGSSTPDDPCDLLSSGPSSSGSSSGGSGSGSGSSSGSGSGGSGSGGSGSGGSGSGGSGSGGSGSGGSGSGGSGSGGSGSGGSGSGGSGSGSGGSSSASSSGGSSSGSEPEPVEELVFTLRSTGTGAQVEMGSQVLYADLVFAVDQDSNVLEISVRNWRQDR